MKKLSLLVFITLSLSYAQQTLELDAPAVWLEPFHEGVAALLADGTLTYVAEEATFNVSKGWLGDSLLECGGAIIGNFKGQLARPESDLFVSRLSLHHRPTCTADGSVVVLSEDAQTLIRLNVNLQEVARAPVDALPDAELVAADVTGDARQEIVLLTGPTERYAHGVLGDRLEATGVSVFDGETLEPVATYTLPEPFVFEQRRVTPFDLGDKKGLLATRSSNETGAGVILLEFSDGELEVAAAAAPIGTGFRWLNLFASQNGRAYAVRTPHIGGPLQRYSLNGDALETEDFQLGVTNHTLGSRNLDLGVLLPELEPGVDHLVLPARNLQALRLIRCDASSCEVVNELGLEARLSSNLAVLTQGEGVQIFAGDENGLLHRWQIGKRP